MRLASNRFSWGAAPKPDTTGARRIGTVLKQLILLTVLLAPGSAWAAPFAVTKTADTNDGSCDADCSLREAIVAANALAGADTVTVPSGTYTLSIGGRDEGAAATGDLDITDALTLNGAGAGSTIIDGNAIDRVFHVLIGTTATLSDVTIRDGDAGGGDGGGIWNESNLTLNGVTMTSNAANNGGAIFSERNPNSLALTNVTLNNNSATDSGGAIGIKDLSASLIFVDVTMNGNTAVKIGGAFHGDKASGTMTRVTVTGNVSEDGGGLAMFDSQANFTLTDVTVSSNTASRRGGGVLADAASTTFNRATVDANSCTTLGGGIHLRGGGTANLTNVTLSGNTCDEGGGVHVQGGHNVTLTNVTLNGNGASGGGGGLSHTGGTLTMTNTIVANSTAGGDCAGTIIDGGNNLDTDGTCLVSLSAPPLLGALLFNGGPTRTHALLAGSPAIDTGTNIGCPTTDQRGVARPFNGTCDVGAYEFDVIPDLLVVKTSLTVEDPFNGTTEPKAIPAATVRYLIQVTNTGKGTVDSDTMFISDLIPANMALRVIDYDGANPGPVAFLDGSPVSGLSYTFTSLDSSTDDVEFSNDGGSTWTYTPVDSGDGTDPGVTDIRVNPKGIFAGSSGGGDPSFQVLFKAVVQ